MQLSTHNIKAINLLTATYGLISNQDTSTAVDERRSDLLQQLYDAHDDCKAWVDKLERRGFKDSCKQTTKSGNEGNIPSEALVANLIWPLSQINMLIFTRLHVALGGKNALKMEHKVQSKATHLMVLYHTMGGDTIWPRMAIPFSIATLETAEQWKMATAAYPGKLVTAPIFWMWMRSLDIRLQIIKMTKNPF